MKITGALGRVTGVFLAVAAVASIAVAAYGLIGWGLAWVLTFFGLFVPWYVMAVAAWLVSLLVQAGSK